MFIKKTTKRVGSKTYVNHLLVEPVAPPEGPRPRVVCSLGSLSPAPAREWLALAHKIESALSGQYELSHDPKVQGIVEQVRTHRRGEETAAAKGSDLVAIHVDQAETENPREPGRAPVGHQLWRRLGVDEVPATAGLWAGGRLPTEGTR